MDDRRIDPHGWRRNKGRLKRSRWQGSSPWHGSQHGSMKAAIGLRAALAVSEITFACVLLVGQKHLIRSFLRVLDIRLGFQPARAVAMRVDPGVGSVFTLYDSDLSRFWESLILTAVVAMAGYLHARRTSRIDPMAPLRRS